MVKTLITLALLVPFVAAYFNDAINDQGTLSEKARHSKVRGLPGKRYWADEILEKGYAKAFQEGKPPYTPPKDWVYNTSSKPVEGKINVHLVPHTHDDTGWQVTVDQYFFTDVYYILDTVVPRLAEDPNRKFIYVEIGFFARWWDQQPEKKQNLTRELVKRGQLEFINGGWCMHDEASPYYVPMVDQTTRGHMFLKKNFGVDAIPKGTWQIDPFGHSNTEAWLIGAESGMQSLFWGRTDYQDLNYRKQARNHTDDRWPEWIWQGSASLGEAARVFAGALGSGGYGTHINFNEGGSNKMSQVQDDPSRHDYNIDAWVDQMIQYAQDQAEITKTVHQMWPCGSDFEYQNADHWYHNLDKLIHYLNLNGTINVMYSTPTLYVKAKHQETLNQNMKWEVREDDIFPLADNSHNYWSGYFTSRPALKRQVRFATNFLQSARQAEVIAKPGKIGVVTLRPSPPVGDSFTDSLEGTIGVATHHDGMSGTERQDVADDYEQRISESHIEAEAGFEKSLQKLMGVDTPLGHCNCNNHVGALNGDCLNISMCAYTADHDAFQVVAWNNQGRNSAQLIRVPVTVKAGMKFEITNLADESTKVDAQLVPLTKRDYELPLLYLTFEELTNASIVDAATNKATHVLVFEATLPPVGYTVFQVKAISQEEESKHVVPKTVEAQTTLRSYSNGMYSVEINNATGAVTSIKNLKSGVSTPLNINWGWYNSSEGGCTQGVSPGMKPCSGQASGAYMFRPNTSNVFPTGPAKTIKTTIVEGPLVTEIRQEYSEWATHVIRLIKDMPYVEVEWTAGPIPMNQPWMIDPANEKKVCGRGGCNWGKEVVIQYSSNIKSDSVFYTDSNGREMVKRKRNARPPSYPPLNVSEPVAGNYYPVNAMLSLNDAETELVVLTDVSQGGSSMKDGEIELMVHRRLQHDDSRGVQEPLNETMCGCNDINADPGQMGQHGHEGDGGCHCAGLTMRGRHLLIFDKVADAHEARRTVAENLQFPAALAFSKETKKPATPTFSAVSAELPENVKLMTLTSNYASIFDGGLMLRFAHLFEVGEHPTLSKPASFSLTDIFAKQGLKITSVEEMSLTGNMDLATMDKEKLQWPTHPPDDSTAWFPRGDAYTKRILMDKNDGSMTITLRPMELRTLIAKFE
jgi:alpha-mannosidase